MRTTIELPDEQRAKLLELAARRGEKGFSKFVQEAVAEYLADAAHDEERIESVLAVLGTLGDEGADALEESVRICRSRWR
jgi:metal-responsive CopG/Arc/MetJ family transcriptional regulator